jgi:hypothetical protein
MRENQIITYHLFKHGYVHENGVITDDQVKKEGTQEELLKFAADECLDPDSYYIAPWLYSRYGNYCGESIPVTVTSIE